MAALSTQINCYTVLPGAEALGGQPRTLDRSYFHVLQSMHCCVTLCTLVCRAW